jgi:hypothetical protein
MLASSRQPQRHAFTSKRGVRSTFFSTAPSTGLRGKSKSLVFHFPLTVTVGAEYPCDKRELDDGLEPIGPDHGTVIYQTGNGLIFQLRMV